MAAYLGFASIMMVLAILGIPAAAANPLMENSGREELAAMGGYGEEKLSTVIVYGRVLCHPCGGHPHLLHREPHPISGASVVVSCKTDNNSNYKKKKSGRRRRRRRWGPAIEDEMKKKKTKTDENGEFLIDLPSHLHAIPDMEKACTVRVAHLPLNSPCTHIPTFTHTPPSAAAAAAAAAISLASNKDGTRSYTAHNITLRCDRRLNIYSLRF